MKVEFLKSRNVRLSSVNWKISEQSRSIIRYYAEYTEYTESEVVDMFLKELLRDKDFMEWVKSKRFNKRILTQLSLLSLIEQDSSSTKQNSGLIDQGDIGG